MSQGALGFLSTVASVLIDEARRMEAWMRGVLPLRPFGLPEGSRRGSIAEGEGIRRYGSQDTGLDEPRRIGASVHSSFCTDR